MSYDKEQQSRDWRFIFDTAEGHRALGNLFHECGVFMPVFDESPHIHAFNEGRRNVALDIIQALEVAPGEFRRISEAIKELNNDD